MLKHVQPSHCLLRELAFKSWGILIAVNRRLLNAYGAWKSKFCDGYLSSLGHTVSRNEAYLPRLPSLLLLQIANDIFVWDALRSFVSQYQPKACSMYTLAALIRKNNRQHVSQRFVISFHSAPANVSAGHFWDLLWCNNVEGEIAEQHLLWDPSCKPNIC